MTNISDIKIGSIFTRDLRLRDGNYCPKAISFMLF